MLNLDPQLIHDLVEDSARELEKHFRQMDELERWMVSSGYGDSADFEIPEDWPENVPFGFVAMLMPQMTHSAPRTSFFGGGNKKMREQVLGLEGAMNIIGRQQKIHRSLTPAAVEFLLGFTCLYIDAESQPSHRLSAVQRRDMKGRARAVPRPKAKQPAGLPRYEDSATPFWPTCDHFPRHCYGWDQRSRTWGRVRFYWHDVVEDYEDLLARAEAEPEQWDLEAIKRLGRVSQSENPWAAAAQSLDGQRVQQVRYRMVFIPEGRITDEEFDPEVDEKPRKVTREPKDHEHGVWMTIGVASGTRPQDLDRGRRNGSGRGASAENQALELAKPFYRRGSRNSPYQIIGPHMPSSSTVPFSPLTATKEQIRLWNELSAATARRMRRYSRQVLYDLKDQSTVDAILDAHDDDFIGIPGFETGKAMVVERGGMSQQDLAHKVHQQDQVYRNLGMSETLQGNATGNTATAEREAVASGKLRAGDIVDAWEQGLSRAFEEMAWHMAYSSDFWVVLDEQAKIEMMMHDVQPFVEAGLVDTITAEQMVRFAAEQEIHVWQGGDFAEDQSLDFGLVRCEIQPFSMERRDADEQKRDLMELVPTLQMIGMLVVTQPHIEWKEILRDLGRVYGRPGLEKLLRMDIAQMLTQVTIAQGLDDTSMGAVAPSGAQKRGGPGGQPATGGNMSPRPTTKPQGKATGPKQQAPQMATGGP